MSTQTQMTKDQATTFLKERITVVGTKEAIEEPNRDFLIKYSTVVGSMEAINIVAPEAAETSVVSEDEPQNEPVDPVVPPTEPTDTEEVNTEVTGDPIVEGDENE